VEHFKYLGRTLTNQNSIHEEIKSTLKLGECLLSFSAESFVFQFAAQIFIKIYRTIILPVVLYGCETWLLWREECRLRVFKNSVLRKLFGPKKDEVIRE